MLTRPPNGSFKASESYSLDLKKGWNHIEYHVTQVFEDSTGKVYPKITEIQFSKNIPLYIKWHFYSEQ